MCNGGCPCSQRQCGTAFAVPDTPTGINPKGEGMVGWQRLLVYLSLCSPPSNANFQTSATLPLFLHFCHWDQPQCASAGQKMFLQFPGLYIFCFLTQSSLLWFLLELAASSGRIGGRQLTSGFVFSPAVRATTPQLLHFCIQSMPQGLCLITGFSCILC